jgi:hypothetical protein
MTSVGNRTPLGGPLLDATFAYILEHPSRKDARKKLGGLQCSPGAIWRNVRSLETMWPVGM